MNHKTLFNQPCVLIITGPTASGKTALSELVLQNTSGEIINADIGQFYTPLSIGTAKPDLSKIDYVAHGFDILHEPRDLSVVEYNDLVNDFVGQVTQAGKFPIIVGGSLFYIKSLFFPPHDLTGKTEDFSQTLVDDTPEALWQRLYAIDPVRAHELHPHDKYRIKRALAIWQKTGMKPSSYKPQLKIPFRAMIVFVCPDRVALKSSIQHRIKNMLREGWVDEVEKLIGTPWELFLKTKGLIGYRELIDWVNRGKSLADFEQVIECIQNKTWAYAKRQVTFWKSFAQQLGAYGVGPTAEVDTKTVTLVNKSTATQVSEQFLVFCNRK